MEHVTTKKLALIAGNGNPELSQEIADCLDEPAVFRPQIRAVLRAAAGRDVQLMLPLVTRVDEVRRAREMVAEEPGL